MLSSVEQGNYCKLPTCLKMGMIIGLEGQTLTAASGELLLIVAWFFVNTPVFYTLRGIIYQKRV